MQKYIKHPIFIALSIGIFGAIGSGTRAGITHMFTLYSSFPIGTWFVNTLGSFLLALLFFHPSFRNKMHPMLYTSVTVGALGSFTTFSLVTFETVELFTDNFATALIYMSGNIVTSVAACFIGYFLVKERT